MRREMDCNQEGVLGKCGFCVNWLGEELINEIRI